MPRADCTAASTCSSRTGTYWNSRSRIPAGESHSLLVLRRGQTSRVSDSITASFVAPFKDHAYVVQTWYEASAVHLATAARSVAEADDVGAVLRQASIQRKLLGVIGQRNKT